MGSCTALKHLSNIFVMHRVKRFSLLKRHLLIITITCTSFILRKIISGCTLVSSQKLYYLQSPDNLWIQNGNGLFPEVVSVDKVKIGRYLDCFEARLAGLCTLLLYFYEDGFNFWSYFVLNYCSSSNILQVSTVSEWEQEKNFSHCAEYHSVQSSQFVLL